MNPWRISFQNAIAPGDRVSKHCPPGIPGGPCFETRFPGAIAFQNAIAPGDRVSKHGPPGILGGPCFETRFPGEIQNSSPRIHNSSILWCSVF